MYLLSVYLERQHPYGREVQPLRRTITSVFGLESLGSGASYHRNTAHSTISEQQQASLSQDTDPGLGLWSVVMSGNIFASSTVPGIKDRDRDKQVVALYGQSYYLSRTSFMTTYWVKLMIGSTLLMIVVPIFLARLFLSAIQQPQPDSTALLSRLFPPALRPGQHIDTNTFRLTEIPISAVLTAALATANDTRSRGLLTHVLLELQNPELTTFAGPGYGVYLKELNRGAHLEAFPDGKLPKCGLGGRYDDWGRVRGLRYAYQWIATTEKTSLMESSVEDDDRDDVNVESMLMGWPALLLERAGVSDPLNPVPPRSLRNVYGEAVDRVVRKLCNRGRCEWGQANCETGRLNSTSEDEFVGENAQERMIMQETSERDLRPGPKFLMRHTECALILPPFLAIYAVAKQDTRWLTAAVEKIRPHLNGQVADSGDKKPTYWMTDTAEPIPTESILDLHEEGKQRLNNSPFEWAGTVRVLSVLEAWKPKFDSSTEEKRVRYGNWKRRATIELKEAINTALLKAREENPDATEVLQFCADLNEMGTCKSFEPNAALTALLVSSVYRLAQLNMLNDLESLEWADDLYNAVARYACKDGKLTSTSLEQKQHWTPGINGSEAQSMVIMMWAARRDCTKVGVCRKQERLSWWHRWKLSI